MVAQPERVPHVPLTAEQTVADAERCFTAGATVLHLRARDAAGVKVAAARVLGTPRPLALALRAEARAGAGRAVAETIVVWRLAPSPDASPSATSNYEQLTAASCGSWRRTPRNCVS